MQPGDDRALRYDYQPTMILENVDELRRRCLVPDRIETPLIDVRERNRRFCPGVEQPLQ